MTHVRSVSSAGHRAVALSSCEFCAVAKEVIAKTLATVLCASDGVAIFLAITETLFDGQSVVIFAI